MKQIIIKFLLCIAVAYTPQLRAQQLQDLINTALVENYQIQLLKNEAQVAVNNNTAGNAGQLPVVDLNGQATTSFNNTRQEFSDGTLRQGKFAQSSNINISALAVWTVFDGFRVYARREQLGYLEELGVVNAQFYIEQTVADIVTAYYQLMREQELLKNYQKSLRISDFRLKLERRRQELGAATGMDYGLALVDYQTDSMRVLEQQMLMKSLEIELNRILNQDLERGYTFADTSFAFQVLAPKDSLFGQAAVSNRQLAIQRLQELVEETNLRIERADRYPKIDLFAGVEYNKTFQEVGFINTNRNLGPTFGLNVSFNLYNGGNTSREIENAEIIRQNAHIDRGRVAKNVDAALLDAYYSYQSVQQRILLAESNVEAAEKVYRISREQLKVGAINGYDFRLTQLTLLNASNQLIQLRFQLKSLEVNIERMTGKILEAYM